MESQKRGNELGEEERGNAERVDEDAEVVEEIAEGEREEAAGVPAERAVGEAVDEQQREAHDERDQTQGRDAHQHARVLQQTQQDRSHRQEDLHQVALAGGVRRQDGKRRHEVGHHDHRADARAVEDHQQGEVEEIVARLAQTLGHDMGETGVRCSTDGRSRCSCG